MVDSKASIVVVLNKFKRPKPENWTFLSFSMVLSGF